jgi:hypothetical protein
MFQSSSRPGKVQPLVGPVPHTEHDASVEPEAVVAPLTRMVGRGLLVSSFEYHSLNGLYLRFSEMVV